MSLSHSESLANIAPALVKAQAELQNVRKENTASVPTKGGGKYEYTYVDLTAVLDAIKPVLAKHGLSASQHPGLREEEPGAVVTVETLLLHESGEWILSEAATPLENTSPQGTGGAITYLRRYALAAILGIGQEDDDGQQASQRRGGQAKRQEQRPAPSAAAEKATPSPSLPTSGEIGAAMRQHNVSVGDMASIYAIGSQAGAVIAFVREQIESGKTLDEIVRHVVIKVAERKAAAFEAEKAAKKAPEETVDDVERAILAEHGVPAQEGA